MVDSNTYVVPFFREINFTKFFIKMISQNIFVIWNINYLVAFLKDKIALYYRYVFQFVHFSLDI